MLLPNFFWARYEDCFHKPTDSFNLGFFRVIYCFSVLLVHLKTFFDINFANYSFAQITSLPYSYYFLALSLLFATTGLWTRPSLFFSIIFCAAYEWSNAPFFRHTTPVVFFSLIVLFFSPGIHSCSIDNTKRRVQVDLNIDSWPLKALQLVVALSFLASTMAKLMNSGWSWISGDSLRQWLLSRYILNDNIGAYIIATHPNLCLSLSLITLIFEGTFFLVIFFPRLAFIYIPLAILFHIGVFKFMDINFFYYFSFSYFAFFNWSYLKNSLQRLTQAAT